MEAADRGALSSFALGAWPPHHVDSRRAECGRGAAPARRLQARRRGAENALPIPRVHGEDDEQIPLADAHALFAAGGSPDKTLRVFTADEGGAQHCQRDYLTLGCATMWNW